MKTEDIKDRLKSEHKEHLEWHAAHSFRLNEIQMWMKEQHEAGSKLLAIHVGVTQHADELQEHAKILRDQDYAQKIHESKITQIQKYSLNNFEEDAKDQLSHEIMRDMYHNQDLKHQSLKNKHREIMILVKKLYELVQ